MLAGACLVLVIGQDFAWVEKYRLVVAGLHACWFARGAGVGQGQAGTLLGGMRSDTASLFRFWWAMASHQCYDMRPVQRCGRQLGCGRMPAERSGVALEVKSASVRPAARLEV